MREILGQCQRGCAFRNCSEDVTKRNCWSIPVSQQERTGGSSYKGTCSTLQQRSNWCMWNWCYLKRACRSWNLHWPFSFLWPQLKQLGTKSYNTCLKDLSTHKRRRIFHLLFSHSFLKFAFLKISGKIFIRDVISCGLKKKKQRKTNFKSDAFNRNMDIFAHYCPHCPSSSLMCNGSLHLFYSEIPLLQAQEQLAKCDLA